MRPEAAGGKFRCEATLERELRARGFRAVAGVDEVGPRRAVRSGGRRRRHPFARTGPCAA